MTSKLCNRCWQASCENVTRQRGDQGRNPDADAELAENRSRLLNTLSTCAPLSTALSPAQTVRRSTGLRLWPKIRNRYATRKKNGVRRNRLTP